MYAQHSFVVPTNNALELAENIVYCTEKHSYKIHTYQKSFDIHLKVVGGHIDIIRRSFHHINVITRSFIVISRSFCHSKAVQRSFEASCESHLTEMVSKPLKIISYSDHLFVSDHRKVIRSSPDVISINFKKLQVVEISRYGVLSDVFSFSVLYNVYIKCSVVPFVLLPNDKKPAGSRSTSEITVTPPAQRVQFILGEEVGDDAHESHPLFSEMEELVKDGDEMEWKETAR